MKGYKVFNPDWTCRGFRYEIGKTYKHEGEIEICKEGFHFCEKLIDCFNYYPFDPQNKVAVIDATGEVIKHTEYLFSKCVTNEIKIVRELSWYEVLDIINIGKANRGINNTGNYNSGNYNSGCNNTGAYNSGNKNSGTCNTGDFNTGNYNVGDCNIGFYNTGNYNIGYYNIGDCNLSNRNTGCFCTNDNKHETIKLFNKESDWTLDTWRNSRAYGIMNDFFELNTWIYEYEMTDEEKEGHPEYKITGGYLKEFSYTEAWKNMWDYMTDKGKEAFTSLPNFDKDIFKTITGIDVENN